MTTGTAVVELPTSREEAWRYTPTDEIRARFVAMGTGPLHRPKLPGIPGIEKKKKKQKK